jgi:hypothetical protein
MARAHTPQHPALTQPAQSCLVRMLPIPTPRRVHRGVFSSSLQGVVSLGLRVGLFYS